MICLGGIYFAYGISGKVDCEVVWTDTGNTIDTYSYDVKWADNEVRDYKRFDYGLSGGFGIEKGPFQFSLKAERGLKNIHLNNIYIYTKDYVTSYICSVSYFFSLK